MYVKEFLSGLCTSHRCGADYPCVIYLNEMIYFHCSNRKNTSPRRDHRYAVNLSVVSMSWPPHCSRRAEWNQTGCQCLWDFLYRLRASTWEMLELTGSFCERLMWLLLALWGSPGEQMRNCFFHKASILRLKKFYTHSPIYLFIYFFWYQNSDVCFSC